LSSIIYVFVSPENKLFNSVHDVGRSFSGMKILSEIHYFLDNKREEYEEYFIIILILTSKL